MDDAQDERPAPMSAQFVSLEPGTITLVSQIAGGTKAASSLVSAAKDLLSTLETFIPTVMQGGKDRDVYRLVVLLRNISIHSVYVEHIDLKQRHGREGFTQVAAGLDYWEEKTGVAIDEDQRRLKPPYLIAPGSTRSITMEIPLRQGQWPTKDDTFGDLVFHITKMDRERPEDVPLKFAVRL